jgi:hypothetical protein
MKETGMGQKWRISFMLPAGANPVDHPNFDGPFVGWHTHTPRKSRHTVTSVDDQGLNPSHLPSQTVTDAVTSRYDPAGCQPGSEELTEESAR